eukprot:Sspe_Gene.99773::Locus_73610_Transcript_1_1_Confidence_1.000_Length_1731::g.99773::m.99773
MLLSPVLTDTVRAPTRVPLCTTDKEWFEAKSVPRFCRSTGRGDLTARFDPSKTHDIEVLQRIRPRDEGPGKYYHVKMQAVMPHSPSPLLKSNLPGAREEHFGDDLRRGKNLQLPLDNPSIDFISTHESSKSVPIPAAGREAPAAFAHLPENHNYTTILFPEPSSPVFNRKRAVVTPRRNRTVPNFKLTTGRDNSRMTWQPFLTHYQELHSKPRRGHRKGSYDRLPSVGTKRGSPEVQSSSDEEWCAKTPSAAGRSHKKSPPVLPPETDRKGKERGKQWKGLAMCQGVPRSFVPTYMKSATPSNLTCTVDYNVTSNVLGKKGDGVGDIKKQAGRLPLCPTTGLPKGCLSLRAPFDVDAITHAWAKRHHKELLEEEAHATAGGSPPPLTVKELLQGPRLLLGTPAEQKRRTRGTGALDLFLTTGRAIDLGTLIGPSSILSSRSKVRLKRRFKRKAGEVKEDEPSTPLPAVS